VLPCSNELSIHGGRVGGEGTAWKEEFAEIENRMLKLQRDVKRGFAHSGRNDIQWSKPCAILRGEKLRSHKLWSLGDGGYATNVNAALVRWARGQLLLRALRFWCELLLESHSQ